MDDGPRSQYRTRQNIRTLALYRNSTKWNNTRILPENEKLLSFSGTQKNKKFDTRNSVKTLELFTETWLNGQ